MYTNHYYQVIVSIMTMSITLSMPNAVTQLFVRVQNKTFAINPFNYIPLNTLKSTISVFLGRIDVAGIF